MIAHIRPPNQTQSPSPLARARRMVAETLLADRPPPSRWRRWRTWLLVGGAIALAAAGGLIYYWFR